MKGVIHLDVETYSALDVRVVGAYKYAEHPTTECLIACYAIADGPVRVWLPYKGERLPKALQDALMGGMLIAAHNAEFERQIWTKVLKLPDPGRHRWRCTAAIAAASGLPRSLEKALQGIGGPTKKDPRGKKLIQIFCKPRKPTKANPSTRIMPEDQPEEFRAFIDYCKTDVQGERHLHNVLPDLPAQEWRNYDYNCLINDRGWPLDISGIESTARTIAVLEKKNLERTIQLTSGLTDVGIRPTQRDKMIVWLKANGLPGLKNLQLKTIEKILREDGVAKGSKAREVLELRLEASKASTKKVKAMSVVTCADGHARGCSLFYGAHTGRIAGKLIQPHNFTRGLLEPHQQNLTLEAFNTGDAWIVDVLYDRPMAMLAQSMRGFIKAIDGCRFVIADYNAIETRVLAWLANEKKLLKIYRDNARLPKEKRLDVYKLMAVVLYKVKYEEVTKEQRRIGKNLRLGAGYQLGVPGLMKNCEKEEIPMDEVFAKVAIRAYRDDSPNIVQLWADIEQAAIMAMDGRPNWSHGCYFEKWKTWLRIGLPSGRYLHYADASIDTYTKTTPYVDEDTGERKTRVQTKRLVTYAMVADRKASVKASGWKLVDDPYGQRVDLSKRVGTYGGKLVENIVQALARDILMHGMLRAERRGYYVVGSVHDEIITMMPNGKGSVKELEEVICSVQPWAKGIPLMAEGFESVRYRKG